MRRHLILLTLPVIAATFAASCGDPTTDVAASPAPATVAIVDVVDDLDYYGACGNETVEVRGTMLYPVLDEDLDAIDEALHPVDLAAFSPMANPSTGGLVRVVAPGPGDDIGRMILYADGLARFESESGRVVWLTIDEQTYDWDC